MEDFLSLARRRQSCRKFDGSRQVSEDDLKYCLEAARLAPSACNSQPYKFTACGGDMAKRVAKCLGVNKFTENASHLIVISEGSYNFAASVGSKIKHQDYRSIDIGIAAAHLTLAAADRGIDSCIIGWFDEKKLKQLLGIKGDVRLVIALGYAEEGYPLRDKKRKPLDEIAEIMQVAEE